MDENGAALLLYARQWTPSVADAEEAVQDGFVRFWKSRYRRAPDPVPLLYTAVKRAAMDAARRRQRRRRRETESGTLQPKAVLFDRRLERDERRAAVEAALSTLPADQREVLVLKIWGDLTFRQIAEALNIPANTAASRYRYAITTLHSRLESETGHDR
jgi:RNA polymerase sigma-70 factor (ECF subfamily)